MLLIQNVVLEGPDCCGKSTLFSNIHRATGYRWNMQDRAHLSAVCYARQFNRGEDRVAQRRRELDSFLLDLNNRLVVLLPAFQVIAQRFEVRGDEVQDIESLKVLHSLFEEEVDRIGSRPNVLVIREPLGPVELSSHCVQWLIRPEHLNLLGVAADVRRLAESLPDREARGCRFKISVDPDEFSVADAAPMRHPPEEVYYSRVLASVLQNIEDELAGKNEYCTKQDPYTTRRFIFTQDSCISLVHTMLRGSELNMRVYCRSSNTEDTFHHDLQFIYYLYSRVYNRLAARLGWSKPARGVFTIDIELGSAHIP